MYPLFGDMIDLCAVPALRRHAQSSQEEDASYHRVATGEGPTQLFADEEGQHEI